MSPRSRPLAPRQRAVLRALGEALFAHPGGPTPAQLDALVAGVEAHLEPVSPVQRALLLLALELVRWLPVLLFMAASPFEGVSLEGRSRLLERMDRSKAAALLLPLVAFKTIMSMHFFESAEELRAMGYPGDERKRWLKIAA